MEVILFTGALSQLSTDPTETVTGTIWLFDGVSVLGLAVTLRMTGGVVSTTVKETSPVAMLPAASLTFIVIKCVPKPRCDPADGLWVTTKRLAGVQLSNATMPEATSGTTARPFAPAGAVMGAGTLTITGGVWSTTLSFTLRLVLLPEASVTVTVINCVPRPTVDPATGL